MNSFFSLTFSIVLVCCAASSLAGQDFSCTDKPDGIYENPTECSTFYKCSGNNAYIYSCPVPLLFNPTLKICDWPQDFQCNKGSSTSEKSNQDDEITTTSNPGFCTSLPSGLYTNPSDCRTFYKCSNGYTYLYDCPSNLVFNPELLVCDWVYNVPSCQSTEGPATDASEEPSTMTSDETPTEPSEEPKTEVTEPEEPSTTVTEVSDEPITNTPEDSTTKASDQPTTGSSGEEEASTEASEEPTTANSGEEETSTQASEEPTTGDSGEEEASTEAPEEPTTGSSGEDETSTQASEEPTTGDSGEEEASTEAPEEPTTGSSGEEETSTQASEEPTTGDSGEVSTEASAEPTTGSSGEEETSTEASEEPTTENSDEEISTKQSSTVVPEEPTTNIPVDPETQEPTTESEVTTEESGENDSSTTESSTEFCKSLPSGLYTNPTDCSTFYKCSNGYTYLYDCPSNLLFNPELLVCDWPYNVPSCQEDMETSTDDAGLTEEQGSESPDEPTTSEESATTGQSEGETTAVSPQEFCENRESGLYTNSEDCQTFYKCSNGYTYLYNCPSKLLFNPELLVCDWPYNVPSCGEDTETSTDQAGPTEEQGSESPEDSEQPEADPTFAPSEKPDEPSTNEESATTGQSEGETTAVPPQEFSCENRESGLYSNPEDCKTFYKCSNGYKYLYDCPSILLFNPDLLICDWPQNVPSCSAN